MQMENQQTKQQNLFDLEEVVNMTVILDIKKQSEFFWMRGIVEVDINQCCGKCFIGETDPRLYHATANYQTPKIVELGIRDIGEVKAYYICGLSKNYNYHKNTHVAFVPETGSTMEIDTDQIHLEIINARHINFQGYEPNPAGVFTKKQRTCRNWIFANYLLDGQPL